MDHCFRFVIIALLALSCGVQVAAAQAAPAAWTVMIYLAADNDLSLTPAHITELELDDLRSDSGVVRERQFDRWQHGRRRGERRPGAARGRSSAGDQRYEDRHDGDEPIDAACACEVCQRHSRGYIRHLVRANEIFGLRLVTLHNLHFYLHLMQRIRTHLEAGTFAQFRRTFVADYVPPRKDDASI